MAIAETAHLVVSLDLKDGLKQGTTAAIGSVSGIERAAGRAHLPLARLSGVTQRAGDAFGHLKGRVAGAAQVLGGAGLLGGVAALSVYARNAVDAATEWADTTRRIHDVTGMSVQDASQMADAFEKLGVSGDTQVRILGFMGKTLGTLGTDMKAAKKIQDDYGFAVTDAKGRMKSSQQVLMDFTTYFNDKTIPAQQKAALGAKLFGRGWMDLLPILEQGKGKLKDALGSAMSMTDGQMRQMDKFRDSQREFNDTMGDLSVQVGMVIVPALTDLAKGLNEFVTQHQDEVLGFFHGMVDGARQLASFIAGTVIPTISNLAGMAKGLWDSIPGPLRDLLVKGFVADRTIKFLFGFSLTDVLKGGLKTLLGGMGGIFARGGSPAAPMYVSDVGGGLGGAGAGAAGRGMGLLGKAALAVEVVGLSAAVLQTVQGFMSDRAAEQAALHTQAQGLTNDPIAKNLTDATNMARLLREARQNDPAKMLTIQTFASKEMNEALGNVGDAIVKHALTKEDIAAGVSQLTAARNEAYQYGWKDLGDRLTADIEQLKAKVPSAPEIGQATQAAQSSGGLLTVIPDTIKRGLDAVGMKMVRGQDGSMRIMTRAAARQERLLGEVTGHLAQVASHKGNREFAPAMTRAARMINEAQDKTGAAGRKATRAAIDFLNTQQKRALAAGHVKLARNLGHDIDLLKGRLAGKQDTTNRHLSAIQAKPTKVSVTVPVTTSVSVRDTTTQTRTASRYGFQAS